MISKIHTEENIINTARTRIKSFINANNLSTTNNMKEEQNINVDELTGGQKTITQEDIDKALMKSLEYTTTMSDWAKETFGRVMDEQIRLAADIKRDFVAFTVWNFVLTIGVITAILI